MTTITLKKNKYIGIIGQKFINMINFVAKKTYTLKYASFIINHPISLAQIFKRINVNFYNIKYIIMGMPKTGNTSLNAAFISKKKNNEEVLFFHSIIELLYADLNFINYNVRDVLNFISRYSNHTVYVISSYRNPVKRSISKIYHNIVVKTQKISNIDINACIRKEIDFEAYYTHILKNELSININGSCFYNTEHGIGTYKYNKKMVFIFTCLEHFDKFEKNISKYIPNLNNFSLPNKNQNSLKEYIKVKENKDILDEQIINELCVKEKAILDYYKLI
jgi:hypothetical protein